MHVLFRHADTVKKHHREIINMCFVNVFSIRRGKKKGRAKVRNLKVSRRDNLDKLFAFYHAQSKSYGFVFFLKKNATIQE